MKHEKIIGSITDGYGLRERDVVLGSDGFEEGALLRGIDDGLGLYQLAGERLGDRIDFQLEECQNGQSFARVSDSLTWLATA
jgi:hypothetical protein